MMTEKNPVLSNAIRCHSVDKVVKIVKAVCVLHNYVRQNTLVQYNAQNFENTNVNNDLVPETLQVTPLSSPQNLRHYLANYFITPHISLPWQYNVLYNIYYILIIYY